MERVSGYRFLLTPRWWAINVFLVLAVPVCLVAGSWQLGRFQEQVDAHGRQQERAEGEGAAEPRPLEELLPLTSDTVGEQAAVTGAFDPGHQLLVPGRRLEGAAGFYVLTPLRPADGGPAVPIVRGWLPGDADDPGEVPAPQEGEVTVTGAVQASESPSEAEGRITGLPDGQLGVISAAALVNVLPYEVADLWLTVRAADAAPPLRAVPAEAPTGTGLDLDAFQNLGYTGEWFVFAGFAVFMWYRLFRREVEARRDAELGLPPPPGASAPPAPREPEGAAARTRSPAPPA
ncbi:SURF1 family protein [Streptomyces sp. DSM 44917]|uniref:SURF1-like protein n=1 Tax=Streptomyces boetiae TaxID=3075541 RepID=A0ABU2LAE7_9ACTN|nr:SURF1 family protein [Streptomyces sp. DSM 44917]MDT0308472.1 SURF1 family protein [Streptomyces sp. DSM 44917]